jgi:hypothetical protein
MCSEKNQRLESLIHYRKSPVSVQSGTCGGFSISAEVISACAYLGDDGVACSLHGRYRETSGPPSRTCAASGPTRERGCIRGAVFKDGKTV